VESFIGDKIPYSMATADDLGVETASPAQKKKKNRSKKRSRGRYSRNPSHETA
jgi:orotate phosphoribosyltransferase-like protein